MIDPITLTVLSAISSPAAAIVWAIPTLVDDDAKALESVEKIIAKYDAARASFIEQYETAETDKEKIRLFDEVLPKPEDYFDGLESIARKHPGSEAAATAASWVVGFASGVAGAWALDMLLADFVDSEHIESVPMTLRNVTSATIAALEKIMAQGGTKRARALAKYQLGEHCVLMSRIARELKEEGSSGDFRAARGAERLDHDLKARLSSEGASEACYERGMALLRKCVKEYGDVKLYPRHAYTVGGKADSTIFELENLQIGCTAPDIEGVDADGVSFNLSDYKGQVIVLNFWGFW